MPSTGTTTGSASPSRLGGRVFVTLFFLIFAAGGSLFVFLLLRDAWHDGQTLRWPVVPCTIKSSTVTRTDAGFYQFSPQYEYQYPPGGPAHTGTGYQRGTGASADYSKSERLSEAWPAGATSTCRVNPDDRDEAVLIPTTPWYALAALFPMLFVVIGLGGAYLVWRKPPTTSPASNPAKPRVLGPRGAAIISSLFLLAGVGVFIPTGIVPAMQVLSARTWTAMPCTVVASSVRTYRGKSRSYDADILYSYDFAGKSYWSNRTAFTSVNSGNRSIKQAIVEQFAPGTGWTCYVDPADPHSAVLDRGFSPPMLSGLIPLLFVILGIAGISSAIRTASRRDEKKLSYHPAHSPARASGAIVLGPVRTPLKSFILTLFFAVLWNGMTAVYIWYRSRPGWWWGDNIAAFIIGTFLAMIGLVAAMGALHALLALHNPHPNLSLSQATLTPGTPAELSWQFTGRFDHITRLTIKLECRKTIFTGSGKSAHADTSVLHATDLIDSDHMTIDRGKVVIALPADAPASSNSDEQRIAWVIALHAEIPHWPDVKAVYEINVA